MRHDNVIAYRQTRRQRKGGTKYLWLLLLTFALVALAALYLGSPFALVDEIVVLGNEHLEKNDILAAAELESGMQLWRLSLASSMDKLSALPWVIEGKIQRRFPNTLEISVLEHSPAAIVAGGGQAWAISWDGTVLTEAEGFSLPWIFGLETDGLTPGAMLSGQAVDIALEYLTAFQPLAAHISDFNFEDYPTQISLYTNDNYLVLLTGREDPGEKVMDLIALLQELRGSGLKGIIDLRAGLGRGIFTPWPEHEDENNN